jgi:DNA polymerase III subunit delta'
MLFKDVVGQAAVKKQLVHLVADNRLSHALLFLGREGCGSLSLARALAQYLVCEKVTGKKHADPAALLFGEPEPVETGFPEDSCGVCPACVKAVQLMHPDIHFSYPVVPKKPGDKPVSTDYITEWRSFLAAQPYGNNYDWLQAIGAENKQGNITAHECTEIIRKLNLKSFESGYKILLMWMPEFLGKEGNKLLKLIEEPPPNTLFILVAETEELILPTIISRTQLVKVPPIDPEDIATAPALQTEPVKARLVAGICDGNLREALQLMQHTDENWLSLVKDCMNAALKTGPLAMVKWVEQVAAMGREKQKQFLKYFLNLAEQGVVAQITGGEHLQLTPEEKDFTLRLGKMAGVGGLEALADQFNNAIYHIERNANGKMLFHALIIRIYHIIANKNVILMN